MAHALIKMFEHSGTEWVLKTEILRGFQAASRNEPMLRYWGLLEERRTVSMGARPKRSGWWRVTESGEEFIHEKLSVPKYVRVYDSKPLDFSGPLVTIRDALGAKFDLDELLGDDEDEDEQLRDDIGHLGQFDGHTSGDLDDSKFAGRYM